MPENEKQEKKVEENKNTQKQENEKLSLKLRKFLLSKGDKLNLAEKRTIRAN